MTRLWYQIPPLPASFIRSTNLESYICAESGDIIQTENLDVDLVAGCHIEMLLTEQEVRIIQADYAAAKAAGVNLDGVEWLSKEVIESVSTSPCIITVFASI